MDEMKNNVNLSIREAARLLEREGLFTFSTAQKYMYLRTLPIAYKQNGGGKQIAIPYEPLKQYIQQCK